MENNERDNDLLDELNIKKECWNGKKCASQIKIDSDATEVFLGTYFCQFIFINLNYMCVFLLGLLNDNWESLSDTKTSKKQVWDVIANGLEEAGFTVRGANKGQTCKIKWENLRKEYRSYLSKFQQTGSSASDTRKKPKFFDEIEKILGNIHNCKILISIFD
jgi:hypothetical protein